MCFCRWNEVTRRIEMWISILELNELGEYAAVELHQAKDVNTGGIFQLRQVPLLFLFHGFSLSSSYTQFLEFSNYLIFCSLIRVSSFILFPYRSPFPFLAPISTSLPHCTPTSIGSFPESASHSKTCTAFWDTATYG